MGKRSERKSNGQGASNVSKRTTSIAVHKRRGSNTPHKWAKDVRVLLVIDRSVRSQRDVEHPKKRDCRFVQLPGLLHARHRTCAAISQAPTNLRTRGETPPHKSTMLANACTWRILPLAQYSLC